MNDDPKTGKFDGQVHPVAYAKDSRPAGF